MWLNLLLLLGIKFQFISPSCNQSTILTLTHMGLGVLRLKKGLSSGQGCVACFGVT